MKSAPIKSVVISLNKAKANGESQTKDHSHTGIDTNHSTMFTVLLVSQTQHYMWTKLDTDQMSK